MSAPSSPASLRAAAPSFVPGGSPRGAGSGASAPEVPPRKMRPFNTGGNSSAKDPSRTKKKKKASAPPFVPYVPPQHRQRASPARSVGGAQAGAGAGTSGAGAGAGASGAGASGAGAGAVAGGDMHSTSSHKRQRARPHNRNNRSNRNNKNNKNKNKHTNNKTKNERAAVNTTQAQDSRPSEPQQQQQQRRQQQSQRTQTQKHFGESTSAKSSRRRGRGRFNEQAKRQQQGADVSSTSTAPPAGGGAAAGAASHATTTEVRHGKQRNVAPASRAMSVASSTRSRGRKQRNTESFKPSYAPPDLRLIVGFSSDRRFHRPMSVHDVVMVPNLFCHRDDTSVYWSLLQELNASSSSSLFTLWHGDTHVIADDKRQGGRWKDASPTFQRVIARMEEYFGIRIKATRFNHYRDDKDWKPYHHDAAAVKPRFAKIQNITVAASFGREREAGFLHTRSGATMAAPQPNGSCYAFCRDVNIEWKHGVLPVRTGRGSSGSPPAGGADDVGAKKPGRISIIAWGWVDQAASDSRIRATL